MFKTITGRFANWYLDASWWKRGIVTPLLSIALLVALAIVLYSVLILPFKLFGWYGLLVWLILIVACVLEGIRGSLRKEREKEKVKKS